MPKFQNLNSFFTNICTNPFPSHRKRTSCSRLSSMPVSCHWSATLSLQEILFESIFLQLSSNRFSIQTVIEEYHGGFKPTDKHPPSNWGNLDELVNVDPENKFVVSTRIRCGRSLQGYPFNPCLTEAQYKEMEEKVSAVFKEFTGELKGTYYPLLVGILRFPFRFRLKLMLAEKTRCLFFVSLSLSLRTGHGQEDPAAVDR